MEIRQLSTTQELLEGAHVIATAFLAPWDEQKERDEGEALATGGAHASEERWGLYDDTNTMIACISTLPHQLAFGGEVVSAGEFHMVGSLPEGRGGGNVRALMAEVLEHFRARGDVFALLIPFSFAFYRKFGFELASRTCTQRLPVAQLAGMSCDYTVTRVGSQKDVRVVRSLYEEFARTHNMMDLRSDKAWEYKGDGEFGERDFLHRDCARYTYVLWDENRVAHAYVTFIYLEGKDGPFVGELKICDLVYDSPDALKGALGFLYRMRAKVTHVSLELLDDLDLAIMVPECENVERSLGGHVMARLLDVGRALELMPHPDGAGSYVVGVTDEFMSRNSGTYRVAFAEGHASSVERTDDAPDVEVTVQTLCQLVVGRIDLEDARYRAGTRVHSEEETLRKVFVRRPVSLVL